MTFGGTETWIGRILYVLGSNAPTGPLSLHLQHARDVSINSDSSSYGDACRPNSYFIVNRRLLLVGEDKVSHVCVVPCMSHSGQTMSGAHDEKIA